MSGEGILAAAPCLPSPSGPSQGAASFVAWRSQSSTTKTEAALLLNVDPLWIGRLEAGEIEPSDEMAERIAIITSGLVSVESWDHPAEKTQTSHGCGSGRDDFIPSPPDPNDYSIRTWRMYLKRHPDGRWLIVFDQYGRGHGVFVTPAEAVAFARQVVQMAQLALEPGSVPK